MANEITTNVGITAAKGGATISTTGTSAALSRTFDMTGTDMVSGTIATSTTTAAFSPAGVTAPYFLFLRNMSSTVGESIRVGNANADPITSLRTTVSPSRENFIYVESGGSVYLESASGTPTLFYAAVEE